MPVRHPILNGFGRLGLGEAAAKMIDASVDTIIKERRHFIGFELSKEYFDKAVRRIKAEQAQLTLF